MQSYLFFGPPGSGKGTQKGMLADVLLAKDKNSVMIIETGQLLRDIVEKKDTPTKRHLSDIMEHGGLVPSAFPISTWVNELMHRAGNLNYLIIDGAGRKLLEAIIVLELLEFFPDTEIHVIYLKVPDNEVTDRLLERGRVDDKKDVIKTRLKMYKGKKTGTTASINFLRKNRGVTFHTVNGVGTVEEVHQRVCDTLKI